MFFCFYWINKRNIEFKNESANTLLSIFIFTMLMSLYLNLQIMLNIRSLSANFQYISIVVPSILIWFGNRIYFIKKENYKNAILEFKDSSKYKARMVAITLIIFSVGLFVIGGIRLSKYLNGW
jgi:hypothetical protein